VANPELRDATRVDSGAVDLALRLLVLRCQAGDEAAFAKLMEMFEARTLAYLRGSVAGDDDADDVQQEVWLTVYRHLGGLADAGAFRTWLFRTTRHRAIDFLRKRKREHELIDDVPLETVAVSTGRAKDDVDSLVVDQAALSAALVAMPPPQREVMLLRYRDELSYQEIAQVVGRPIGTVRTRLHHARKRLQEFLKGRDT
jgi:RNA polymerase sigma-70 factor (ECF subfamily)